MYTIKSVYRQSNLKLAYRRIITNPESTYKNFFRDTYSFYAMAIDDNTKSSSAKIKAGYMPEQSIRVFMPKSNGLSRMYTLLSLEDQIVYQAFANIIAEAISTDKVRKRYRKSVFGNLYTSKESEFFYQPWKESYKSYTKAIVRAHQKGNAFIASFDLTACYDSINHSLLKQILVANHISENCVNEFIRLLGKWESTDGLSLGTGIPQGPLASGIIAEVVLAKYDEYAEQLQKKYEFKYYRYVDDIRILSHNEETVKWVLFLLDRKSKELGLFPQSSKITVHKISNIEDEIKRISKPLFDDEFDDDQKQEYAQKSIRALLKEDPADLTSIKRYFQFVGHNSKTNKLAIMAVSKFPNLIHSFAYYVYRYPRVVPKSLIDYIFSCCLDNTKQFSAGILLESIITNINTTDQKRFAVLANTLLKRDKTEHFLVDCRFKAQLMLIVSMYGKATIKSIHRRITQETNWWIKKELISKLFSLGKAEIAIPLSLAHITKGNDDVALCAAHTVLLSCVPNQLPPLQEIAPIAQNTLKRAGMIQRSRYSNSQINRYLSEIIKQPYSYPWKKKLGKEHAQLELNFFQAFCYWQTDLTAFVNLWDTIDDRLCSLVVVDHSELGGYTLGTVGGISNSKGFKSHLPAFHKMVNEIHELRLTSHLSHSKVKRTNNYTGPIKSSERKRILALVTSGINELTSYW